MNLHQEIVQLEKEKALAVKAEDFSKAERLKKKIEHLKASKTARADALKEIESLKKQKVAAVKSEDFSKAELLKKKIENLESYIAKGCPPKHAVEEKGSSWLSWASSTAKKAAAATKAKLEELDEEHHVKEKASTGWSNAMSGLSRGWNATKKKVAEVDESNGISQSVKEQVTKVRSKAMNISAEQKQAALAGLSVLSMAGGTTGKYAGRAVTGMTIANTANHLQTLKQNQGGVLTPGQIRDAAMTTATVAGGPRVRMMAQACQASQAVTRPSAPPMSSSNVQRTEPTAHYVGQYANQAPIPPAKVPYARQAPVVPPRRAQNNYTNNAVSSGAAAAMAGLAMSVATRTGESMIDSLLGVSGTRGHAHTSLIEVQVPENVFGGQLLQVPHPETGRVTTVTIPNGLLPGHYFKVQLPK
eukprot:g5314.t1